jgi:hypothetical protein
MDCAECNAFLLNYRLATERYAGLSKQLLNMTSNKNFRSREFQHLKEQTESARIECVRAKEALRIHREGHAPQS